MFGNCIFVYFQASTLSINVAVDLYGTDLECYAHKQLPRFKMPKSFHDRPDSAYLYMVRTCPYIHTLVIRYTYGQSKPLKSHLIKQNSSFLWWHKVH